MDASANSHGTFTVRFAMGSFIFAVIAGLTLGLFLLFEIYGQSRLIGFASLFASIASFVLSTWIIERFWDDFVAEFERQISRKEHAKAVSWARWAPFTCHMQLVTFTLLFGTIMYSRFETMALLSPAVGAMLAMAVGMVAVTKQPFVKELRK